MNPALSDKHERLARGVGSWVGEERMPDPKGGPEVLAQGRSEARLCAAGCALATDYTQSVNGRVTINGHAVTIWHPSDECYVMYWFDASGAAPSEFRGDYDGDALVLEGPGPNGSRIRHRTEYPDDHTSRTVSTICFDGKTWTEVYDGTLVRTPT